mgnify:CR=1 FL=1
MHFIRAIRQPQRAQVRVALGAERRQLSFSLLQPTAQLADVLLDLLQNFNVDGRRLLEEAREGVLGEARQQRRAMPAGVAIINAPRGERKRKEGDFGYDGYKGTDTTVKMSPSSRRFRSRLLQMTAILNGENALDTDECD